MKSKIFLQAALAVAAAGVMTSCNDYLDQEPQSQVTPENYFNQEAHLSAYANNLYTSVLPSHGNWSYGMYGSDLNTDNMISLNYDDIYVPGKWKTGMSNGNWSFTTINSINYFFERVLPNYENNAIQGSDASIRHYIGEMYFMRALTYFSRLKTFGDFPIITECLPDNLEVLSEASKRSPQNEVARFILDDLSKAADYMSATNMAKTRINADVAHLIRSRVALYEGTWLKNFAGTAFVPGTKDWPGAAMYPGYQFPAGSLEAEANWFLDEAMKSAKVVGDKAQLVENTGIVPQTAGASQAQLEAENPWLATFATLDLEKNPEVLLWRQYSRGLGIVHNICVYAQVGNNACGTTRGLVDSFICADGLPIYASPLYMGDTEISLVRQNRDPRLFVFLKEPGQKNQLIGGTLGTHATPIEPYPQILTSTASQCYPTGYALRKGNYYENDMCGNGNNYTACPVYRSVEALLNYVEACYERNGNLDATAAAYWTKIRARHTGLDTDYMKTVNATDMQKEAQGDWGAYTAGVIIEPLRYNIRRERRCELIAEDFRWADLKRWRSFDQLITKPYHVEGMHIWGTPMQDWYDQATLKATVNSPERSEYLRPFEYKGDSEVWDGLRWSMAHYWDPLPIYQMILTSPDHTTVTDSPIYQNPYWPTEPNMPATK